MLISIRVWLLFRPPRVPRGRALPQRDLQLHLSVLPRLSGWLLLQEHNLSDGIDGGHGGGTDTYYGDEKGDDLGVESQ